MTNLADTLKKAGDYAQAEKVLKPAPDMERRVLGPDHPNTAVSAYNLACIQALQGKRTEALSLLRQSLDHGLPSWMSKDMATDSGLSSLHGDPRFAALLAGTVRGSAKPQIEFHGKSSHRRLPEPACGRTFGMFDIEHTEPC